jgi:hypothetical protein
VDWIHLAQNKNRRQEPLNTVVNFRVPQNAETSFRAAQMLTSKEGLSSMELVQMEDASCNRRETTYALYCRLCSVKHMSIQIISGDVTSLLAL